MKTLVKLLSVLLLAVVVWLPSTSHASQCLAKGSRVDTRNGFCFTFNIDSDGTNRVRLESSRIYYPLWTDDNRFYRYNPRIYERSYVYERKERTFRVKFDRFNNSQSKIKGRLTYYVDGVQILRDNSFDLTRATGVTPDSPYLRLNVVGGQFNDPNKYCINSGDCSDLAEFEVDVCPYVPNGLQTNVYASQRPFGALQVTTNSSNFIHPSNNDPQYSFSSRTDNPNMCQYPNNTSGACTIDPNKKHPTLPVALPSFREGDAEVKVYAGNPKHLPSGEYEEVKLYKDSKLLLTGGNYWIEELKFEGVNAQIEVLSPSIIHYEELKFKESDIKINLSGNSHDLLFIGHGNDSNIKIPVFKHKDSNYQINAFFYIDPAADDDDNGFVINGSNNVIRGGITAHSIAISGANNSIYALSCENTPQPDVASIVIKPFNYHLTCESDPSNIVEVHMLDSNGDPVAGLRPTLVQENGSNLSISFISEANGIAKYRVRTTSTSTVGNYDLKATLTTGGQTFEDTEQIKYVPYKFEVADQYVIAGQNNQVPVSVKACSTSGQLITLGYTGRPSATFTYQRPSSAVVDSNDLTFSANLNNNNREADLNFKESGHIRVTMTDNSFVCDDVRCPVEGGALKGQFDVYSRPWKIAICNVVETANTGNTNPGTTDSGSGFMAGGAAFSVTYKPIVHSDSSGGVGNQCNYPITGNYGLDNGQLNLTHSVIYPSSNPQSGSLTPSSVADFDANTTIRTQNHTWSEVGSLEFVTNADYLNMKLDSDTQTIGRFYPKYFKVVQPSGGQANPTVWNYPGAGMTQQDFVYMNQPFEGVEFKVEALNATESSVQNYAAFDSSLTAGFALYEPNTSYTGRFYSPAPSKAWQVDSNKSIGQFTVSRPTPSAVCSSEVCWAKAATAAGYEDGPFNQTGASSTTISITDVGVTNTDPIAYPSASDSRLLPVQPVIRFGRAVLDSVGDSTTSTLNVPLRVEYWDGNRFITNSDDNNSLIDGVNVESSNRDIWVEPNATAADVTLAAGGRVASGSSTSITATQSKSVRQQTQVWLELHSGTNAAPWLRYRWQDANRAEVNGEEDPSTVLTFGIFRGNDRVIFRGESGLTGQ